MTSLIRNSTRTLAAAMVMGSLVLSMPTMSAGGRAVAATRAEDYKVGEKVKLTLRDGRAIEGEIVEITTDGYRIKISIGTATYARSEISKMERTGGAAKAPDAKPAEAKPAASTPAGAAKPADAKPSDDGEKPVRIYVMTLKGEIGRDVTETPMKAALADAKKQKADILVIKVDCAFEFHGKAFDPRQPDPRGTSAAYQQLETVRELDNLYTDAIRDDSEWDANTPTKKPRLVMWVRNALGGAAFMPWIAPEIYMTQDGKWGGVGYIEFIFGSMGDRDPREKQFSLRLARAKSLAEAGGHEPKLVMAMSRMSYVLSVSYVGGRPVYHEDSSGDELLTDDGNDEAGRMDAMEDVLRLRGNDNLNLDATRALKLQLTRATVDNMSEMANEMGIARNYVELKPKSDEIFKQWSSEVDKAEEEFIRLFRDYRRIETGGQTREERNKGRSQQLAVLNKVVDLLKKYKEAINPNAIQGAPDDWFDRLEVRIAQIKQEMRLDR